MKKVFTTVNEGGFQPRLKTSFERKDGHRGCAVACGGKSSESAIATTVDQAERGRCREDREYNKLAHS
ncbi:hypothetical protein [Lentibacillus persicus]|uniref:hypothetical protein n=1 Tax=Lentibacillus persicus TaxID=640948 RepID=UPI000B7F6472|nr:hypothetical protein [Lentibacillus persicus]